MIPSHATSKRSGQTGLYSKRFLLACREAHSTNDTKILLRHLAKRHSESGLLFFNRNGRPYSANKLREKQLHPLLVRLGIPGGGFHAARHGATSEMLAPRVAPTVLQMQMRHSEEALRFGWASWAIHGLFKKLTDCGDAS
jgi:integrase